MTTRKKSSTIETVRLYLTYPSKLINRPLVWELGHRFQVVTNIHQASVSHRLGLIDLELRGESSEIQAAIQWLEKHGVKVEVIP